MVQGVELNYQTNASALLMAQTIFGAGVNVVGASYVGDNRASAIYSGGDSIAPGVTPSDTGVILSTGQARAFTNDNASQSNLSNSRTTSSNGPNNDPDFNALAGRPTYDASYLNVDFIPDPGIDFITIEFVFSSDEYPEYAGSIYNDMVGVWIDGNPVPLAAGTGDISVGNINQSGGVNLFRSNTGDQYNTEMDGFTVSMSVTIPVRPGEVNSLRIGVADVSDNRYDSNLLIASDSVQGTLVAVEDDVLLRPGTSKTVDVLANDINKTTGSVTITQINGQDVLPGDSVTLTTGQTVTLNADGTLTLLGNTQSTDVAFTYGIASTTGDSAVGFITIDTIPCFASGTLIRVDGAEMPVERLSVGDLVETRDGGLQPIRWIGRRRVPAEGPMAPIRIMRDTLGAHDTLLVSPLHRVLLRNAMAEFYYGSHEVLAAARDIVDGNRITRVEGGHVEYVHLLFDEHQIVWSAGLETESFMPGPQTTHCFGAEMISEITTIFPELDPLSGDGYGPAARPALKRCEAQLLVA